MSFGFKIWNSAGTQILSSADLSFNLIDLFQVSPTSSGSRTYSGLAGKTIIVAQSAVEPTAIDFTSLFSLNSVSTNVYDSGPDKVLNWSPGMQYLSAYNVQLYVFGF